jgi:hypothetical protein
MNKYECNNCKKSYQLKYNYEQHKAYCDFAYLCTREKNELFDTVDENEPTKKEMFKVVKFMCFKLEKQELEIEKLKKEMTKLKQTEKSKINILEWLNNTPPVPQKCFKRWINDNVIPIVKNYLETVFNENLQTGIINVLEEAIAQNNLEEIPIRYYDNKSSVFYILKKTKNTQLKWYQITNLELDVYISAISKQFGVDFNNHWIAENEEKIKRDEKYKDLYDNYCKNILGGDSRSHELMHKNVRELICKKIKQSIKPIREYEIH